MLQVGMTFYVCFQNLGSFKSRISPFPTSKIVTKKKWRFYFHITTFPFFVLGSVLSLHLKKGQEQTVLMLVFFLSKNSTYFSFL